ncbi:MAG: hypothetical protein ACRETU_03105 [Steroidobacterales bacterium]
MRSWVMNAAMAVGLVAGLQGCAQEKASPPVAASTETAASTPDKAGPLEGAWELIAAKSTPADDTFPLDTERQIKILTRTHWAFLSQQRKMPKMPGGSAAEWAAAAKSFSAGGGTYTLDGDTYSEHIEFFVSPKFVGTTINFKITWNGDEWTQSGTLPLKSLGVADHDVDIQETYRRMQ